MKIVKNILIVVIILIVIAAIVALVYVEVGNPFTKQSTSAAVHATSTAGTTHASSTATSTPVMPGDNITVTASSTTFSPDTFTVAAGDRVNITVMDATGSHNFVIDDLKIKTPTLVAKQKMIISFVVSKAGTYTYYSSVGTDETKGMKGTMIVK